MPLNQTTPSGPIAGPVTVADGADVMLGATTAAAVDTDTTGTVSGKLRGLVKLFVNLLTRVPAALGAGGGFKVDGSGTALPVTTGGLTDTQLRATPVPVSGTVSVTGSTVGVVGNVEVVNDVGNPLPVNGTVAVSGVVPGTGAASLGKAEDSVAADGDTGVAQLGVRQDIPITDTTNVGDYVFMKADAQGRLWVNSDLLGTILNRNNDFLQQVLMEMRISNTLLQEGLNTRGDLDNLRQDPYYCNTVN